MIQGINVAEIRNQKLSLSSKKTSLADSVKVSGNFTSFSRNACEALKSQIAFTGNGNRPVNGLIIGMVEDKQSINALLTGKNAVPNDYHFKGDEYSLITRPIENGKSVEILNKDGKSIIRGQISDNLDSDVKIEFNVAKHAPEIKITKGDSTIQLLEGSSIKDVDGQFEFTFPGVASKFDFASRGATSTNISFTGVNVSLLCEKDATFRAVTHEKPAPFVGSGVYWERMAKDDPSIVALAGGFGKRFKNLTAEGSNKPAFVLPNGQSLVGAALDLAKNAMAI